MILVKFSTECPFFLFFGIRFSNLSPSKERLVAAATPFISTEGPFPFPCPFRTRGIVMVGGVRVDCVQLVAAAAVAACGGGEGVRNCLQRALLPEVNVLEERTIVRGALPERAIVIDCVDCDDCDDCVDCDCICCCCCGCGRIGVVDCIVDFVCNLYLNFGCLSIRILLRGLRAPGRGPGGCRAPGRKFAASQCRG